MFVICLFHKKVTEALSNLFIAVVRIIAGTWSAFSKHVWNEWMKADQACTIIIFNFKTKKEFRKGFVKQPTEKEYLQLKWIEPRSYLWEELGSSMSTGPEVGVLCLPAVFREQREASMAGEERLGLGWVGGQSDNQRLYLPPPPALKSMPRT